MRRRKKKKRRTKMSISNKISHSFLLPVIFNNNINNNPIPSKTNNITKIINLSNIPLLLNNIILTREIITRKKRRTKKTRKTRRSPRSTVEVDLTLLPLILIHPMMNARVRSMISTTRKEIMNGIKLITLQ